MYLLMAALNILPVNFVPLTTSVKVLFSTSSWISLASLPQNVEGRRHPFLKAGPPAAGGGIFSSLHPAALFLDRLLIRQTSTLSGTLPHLWGQMPSASPDQRQQQNIFHNRTEPDRGSTFPNLFSLMNRSKSLLMSPGINASPGSREYPGRFTGDICKRLCSIFCMGKIMPI